MNPDLSAPCYSGPTQDEEESRTSSPIDKHYLEKSIRTDSEVLIQNNNLEDISVRRPKNRSIVDQLVLNQSILKPEGDSEDDNITIHKLLQRRDSSDLKLIKLKKGDTA